MSKLREDMHGTWNVWLWWDEVGCVRVCMCVTWLMSLVSSGVESTSRLEYWGK